MLHHVHHCFLILIPGDELQFRNAVRRTNENIPTIWYVNVSLVPHLLKINSNSNTLNKEDIKQALPYHKCHMRNIGKTDYDMN